MMAHSAASYQHVVERRNSRGRTEPHVLLNMFVGRAGILLMELFESVPTDVLDVEWVSSSSHHSKTVWVARLNGMVERRATALRGSEAAAMGVLAKLIIELVELATLPLELDEEYNRTSNVTLAPLHRLALMSTRESVAVVSSQSVVTSIHAMRAYLNALGLENEAWHLATDALLNHVRFWQDGLFDPSVMSHALPTSAVTSVAAADETSDVESDYEHDEQENGLDAEENVPEDDASLLCKICLTKRVTTVLIPCGHALACNSCAMRAMSRDARCPSCRAGVARVQRLFLS